MNDFTDWLQPINLYEFLSNTTSELKTEVKKIFKDSDVDVLNEKWHKYAFINFYCFEKNKLTFEIILWKEKYEFNDRLDNICNFLNRKFKIFFNGFSVFSDFSSKTFGDDGNKYIYLQATAILNKKV